jgi:GH15 family glucan-1,4-alpha-glucosidase
MRSAGYPPISDYGYIADCHSSALISRSCSIDWCCMPRMDSPSCFGRLLDWERGGHCGISPVEPYEISRRYVDKTLILETTFRTSGAVRIRDCFTMRQGGEHHPYKQILRVIEGVRGEMDLKVEIMPRFDYGAVRPWIRSYKRDHFIALGGSHGLLICGDVSLHLDERHDLAGSCRVREGQRLRLSLLFRKPEELDEGAVEVPGTEELDRRLEETLAWWQEWSSRTRVSGPYAGEALRSALVLKGLSNAPTGAIAAAPTTSLPEVIGGTRNWDYRFTWIRDSAFTVHSLAQVGHDREADRFRRFVERTAAGSADEVQVVFGVGGERRLEEMEIQGLEGYSRSRPVRVGNRAQTQTQLDVYGEILDLSWTWYNRGHEPDEDYWDFLVDVLNAAVDRWHLPDQGIWEMRGKPRHFVHSKAMCWSALDRGVKMAEKLDRQAPVDTWRKARDRLRSVIEEKGYDRDRKVFIQAFGFPRMDSALLLLPVTGFLGYDDERMIRTTDAIQENLGDGGLLRRYQADDDGLDGREGVFLPCSFWLVECLVRQGRIEEAQRVFKKALSAGNDLSLFSEEYDPQTGEMLGNFPQGLTHLSLIAAVVALDGVNAGRPERGGA